MWTTIAGGVVIAVFSYTFGILVGLKLSKILNQAQQVADSEPLSPSAEPSAPVYAYVINPNTTDITYQEDLAQPDNISQPNEVLKTQYLQRIQAIVIGQQLQLHKDAVAVLNSEAKFHTYLNNPFVQVKDLQFLLDLLNAAELFEWSQLTLNRIKQLQDESKPNL